MSKRAAASSDGKQRSKPRSGDEEPPDAELLKLLPPPDLKLAPALAQALQPNTSAIPLLYGAAADDKIRRSEDRTLGFPDRTWLDTLYLKSALSGCPHFERVLAVAEGGVAYPHSAHIMTAHLNPSIHLKKYPTPPPLSLVQRVQCAYQVLRTAVFLDDTEERLSISNILRSPVVWVPESFEDQKFPPLLQFRTIPTLSREANPYRTDDDEKVVVLVFYFLFGMFFDPFWVRTQPGQTILQALEAIPSVVSAASADDDLKLARGLVTRLAAEFESPASGIWPRFQPFLQDPLFQDPRFATAVEQVKQVFPIEPVIRRRVTAASRSLMRLQQKAESGAQGANQAKRWHALLSCPGPEMLRLLLTSESKQIVLHPEIMSVWGYALAHLNQWIKWRYSQDRLPTGRPAAYARVWLELARATRPLIDSELVQGVWPLWRLSDWAPTELNDIMTDVRLEGFRIRPMGLIHDMHVSVGPPYAQMQAWGVRFQVAYLLYLALVAVEGRWEMEPLWLTRTEAKTGDPFFDLAHESLRQWLSDQPPPPPLENQEEQEYKITVGRMLLDTVDAMDQIRRSGHLSKWQRWISMLLFVERRPPPQESILTPLCQKLVISRAAWTRLATGLELPFSCPMQQADLTLAMDGPPSPVFEPASPLMEQNESGAGVMGRRAAVAVESRKKKPGKKSGKSVGSAIGDVAGAACVVL